MAHGIKEKSLLTRFLSFQSSVFSLNKSKRAKKVPDFMTIS